MLNEQKAKEAIQKVRNGYEEVIKPLIREKAPQARFEMGNLVFALDYGECGPIFAKYSFGLGFIASANVLLDRLKEGDYSESTVRLFEMELSQLEMAIKSGNSPFLEPKK